MVEWNKRRWILSQLREEYSNKVLWIGTIGLSFVRRNQQKVVLAKWLERNAEVLIFDEPTRGIDVGAKYEIYEWMNRLADQGKCILMISSELPEVLGMSDRILVMRGWCVVGELRTPMQLLKKALWNLQLEEKNQGIKNENQKPFHIRLWNVMGLNCFVRFLQSYYL